MLRLKGKPGDWFRMSGKWRLSWPLFLDHQGWREEGAVGLWRCSEPRFWGNGRVSHCAGRQAGPSRNENSF